MPYFEEFILYLKQVGVADVIIPFTLVFTVIYAVLQKSKILGKDSKNFNVVIAILMGFAVVIPHVLGMYGRPSVVDVINASLPEISLMVVAIVMFLLMLGIFGRDVKFADTSLSGWAVLVSLIAVVLIFGSNAGWFTLPAFLYFLQASGIQHLLVVILVFGSIIWFITHEPDEDKEKGALEKLGDVIKHERKS